MAGSKPGGGNLSKYTTWTDEDLWDETIYLLDQCVSDNAVCCATEARRRYDLMKEWIAERLPEFDLGGDATQLERGNDE